MKFLFKQTSPDSDLAETDEQKAKEDLVQLETLHNIVQRLCVKGSALTGYCNGHFHHVPKEVKELNEEIKHVMYLISPYCAQDVTNFLELNNK